MTHRILFLPLATALTLCCRADTLDWARRYAVGTRYLMLKKYANNQP